MRPRSIPTAILLSAVLASSASAQRLSPAAVSATARPLVVTPRDASPFIPPRDTALTVPQRESTGDHVMSHGLAGGAIGLGVGVLTVLIGSRNESNHELDGLAYMVLGAGGAGLGFMLGAIEGAITSR